MNRFCRRARLILSPAAFLVAAGMLFPAFAPAETFTLEQAVSRALEANPTIESKLLSLEQARYGIGVSQSSFWPRVSLVANRDKLRNRGGVGSSEDLSSKTDSHGLQMTLSLFAGFAHLNDVERSLIAVDIASERHKQARLELIGNVHLQFLQLIENRANLKHLNEAVTRIESQLDAAKAFAEVGMAPYVDVLQNEAELSKATQDVIRARNAIRNAQARLNHFLGFPPNEDNTFTGRLESFGQGTRYDEMESIQKAMHTRPDIQIANYSIRSASKESDIVAGRYLPKVDFVFNKMKFDREYSDARYINYDRNYSSVSLRFTWDIFDGGNTTFSYLSNKKRMKALQKDYEDVVSAARTDIIKTMLDIDAARELIATSEAGIRAAREGYRQAEKRYATNTGTITELLDAQTRLTRAESDAVAARAEYQRARSSYFFNIGSENPALE